MVLDLILRSLLLPGLAAGVVLLIGTRPWRKQGRAPNRWIGAAAVGTAYLVGHLAVAGWPGWVPLRATGWLLHIAAAAVAVALVESRAATPTWLRWLLRVGLAVVAAWLLLRVPVANQWSAGKAALYLGGVALGMLSAWVCLDRATAANDPRLALLLLLILATTGAIVVVLSGSLLVGQLGVVLAAAMGAALVFAMLFPGAVAVPSMVPPIAAVAWASWTIALLFADMPTMAALLLGLAPATMFAADRAVAERLGGYLAAAVRLAAVTLCLAGALGVAADHYFAGEAPGAGEADSSYGYEFSD